jgi:signal transduction histidine kinase
MLDVIPPVVILILAAAVTGAVVRRSDGIPHWRLAVACMVGSFLYGLGTLLFVLKGGPEAPAASVLREGWRPGVALASQGTFLIPAAIVFALHREKAIRAFVVVAAIIVWCLIWIEPLRPLPWNTRLSELCFALYLALATALIAFGLRRQPDSQHLGKLALFFLPFVATALAYLLAKSGGLHRPLASTCVQAGALVAVLPLVSKRPKREVLSPRASALVQAMLLGLGAVLTLVLAANLGLFPKEGGPLIVATVVATGLAVAYGTLRPDFNLFLARAFAPEATRVEERVRTLQAELEATRGRLRQAEHLSLVGQLAAQVAHEIKNPLGPIKGYTKIIERETLKAGALNEVVQRGIGIIRQEVEAIDERAQGLLQLARPPQPDMADLDYAALGQDVLDLLASDCPPGVELRWAGGAPPPSTPGRGDEVLLRGALINVAQNAVQAIGDEAGAVELSLHEGELWIEDTGPGLPGDPEELFRPFVSHREGGNGLGLLIARGALRAMGGDVTLQAREEGGVRAVFTLPREDGEPTEPDTPEETTP